MEKNWITTIQALLNGRNKEFDAADKERVRLIRHKDNREKVIDGKTYKNSLYDIYLHDNDVFMSYQSEQVKKDFINVDYIVAFIGEEGVSSRFVGVYKNYGVIKDTGIYNNKVLAKFDFRVIDGFQPLNERVVIDWEGMPRNWRQYYCNEMPVIRIDRGLEENNIPVFTKFEDVMLSYDQLALIFKKNNAEWKSKLESCNCIYLILDKSNGKQYVGSTYNKQQGIWGRWSDYAKTGHGDDKDLESLLQADPNYARKNFQWCILETLPLNVLADYAIDRESLYKRKFGTRDFGYNNN